jgi:hypothetical protein
MGQPFRLGWVAVMVVLTACAGPRSAPVMTRSAPSEANLGQLVRDFYSAVDERRYQDAYAYLSRAARDQQPLGDFARPFESIVRIDVRWVDGVAVEGTTASLVAHTATTSKGQPPGVAACSRFDLALVFEDGGWKRESASASTENCDGG